MAFDGFTVAAVTDELNKSIPEEEEDSIIELYDDAENGGRFFYGVTGINGTPDSVVCAGVKK